MTQTLVVIVNYRTAAMVEDCLRSLEQEVASGDVRVVVTDNDSGDGDRLAGFVDRAGYGAWASVVPLPKNGGFAYGNNAAIRGPLASPNPPRYVWLLNPDTLVRPGALRELVAFLNANPKAGIAGSRLEDPDGTPQRSAFRFHSFWSELENGARLGALSKALSRRIVAPPVPVGEEPVRTDWVAGASMLVKREVFEQAGLLDEGYFMYFEEVDFHRRAAEAGYECWYVPRSRVVHLVGQASGVTDKNVRRRRPGYWFDARARYFASHHGRIGKLAIDLAWAGGYASYRLRRALQRKPDTDSPRLLWDFVRHNLLPGARG